MSIREILANCYETSGPITIDLELSKQITLEEIFIIIYMLSHKKIQYMHLKDDLLDKVYIIRDIVTNYTITDVDNPDIVAMLYYLYSGNNYYYNYNNKDEFIKFAKLTDMIHYNLVRNLMKCLGIKYDYTSGTAELFVRSYLGLLSAPKSTRKK